MSVAAVGKNSSVRALLVVADELARLSRAKMPGDVRTLLTNASRLASLPPPVQQQPMCGVRTPKAGAA